MNFFGELKRRNVIKVAAAYVIVGWLIMQAGEVMAPALNLPDWVNSMLAFFLILGFPVALVFAWAFEMTPEGLKKEKDVDRSASITNVTGRKLDFVVIGLLAATLAYFAVDKFFLDPQRDSTMAETVREEAAATGRGQIEEERGPDDKSIAVLPFVNMSSDLEQEFFSDGITEELLNLLAKIPELKVTSRSSVFSFKGQAFDIPTVAEKLGVAHVLEGSVRKSGNKVRITAQLIEAGTDVHMWSETYDRELDDVFAIQDEIASEVVSALKLQILGEVPEIAETNVEAYAAYLKGRHHIEGASDVQPMEAVKSFREALAIDPNYAPAWAGLARALRWAANWALIDLHEGTAQAREAVARALELDDTLAEAWGVLARIQFAYDWDWYAAQGTLRTALMYGPRNSLVLMEASNIERAIGNFDEAVEFAIRAEQSDPLNPVILRNSGLAHWSAGDYEQALRTMVRKLELYPDRLLANHDVAWTLLMTSRPEEAYQYSVAEEKNNLAAPELIAFGRAMIAHSLGRDEASLANTEIVIEEAHEWLGYQIAEIYGWRGETDKAFEWLENSYQQRDGGITHMLGDPSFRALHNDPRWEPFLLKVGLLKGWQNAQAHWAARQ